ncbi:MAG: response regulator [Pseudomonadota bacterium]
MLKVVEPPMAHGRPPVVLFVDDEPRVLTSMRALFRKGYQVRTANSATEALAVLADGPVDLIVSDQRMPHMTGVELLARVRREYPATRRILLTGYADLTAIESALNECEVARYLVKPCPPDELRAAAAAVLAQPADGDVMEPALMEAEPAAADGSILADVVVLNPDRQETPTAPTKAPRRADVLVLSDDPALGEALSRVVATIPADADVELPASIPAAAAECHIAPDLGSARSVLTQHPVGVIVTDTVLDAEGLAELKAQLLHGGAEPLFIVAADRSDASRLIDLINGGLIFRFLLKPLGSGQCRLWLHSARRRFRGGDETVATAGEQAPLELPQEAANEVLEEAAPRQRWWSRWLDRWFSRAG